MGPSRAGVFVPHSWTLLPSDDGPIVHASSGPAPFRPADKAPFHKTSEERRRGRGQRKAVMEVWKGRGDWRERRVKGSKERVVIGDGAAVVKHHYRRNTKIWNDKLSKGFSVKHVPPENTM